MAYTKTNWVNGTTPINATNLNHIEDGIFNIYNDLFPIGSIVIKADNSDYSNWLGFTWERTLVGRVAVGIDSTQTEFDTIGETGGSKTHQLSPNELTWHNHQVTLKSIEVQSGNGAWCTTYEESPAQANIWTMQSGDSRAFNILQPYQVVAYWKRTA